jgi:hypothetical protein
MGHAALHRALQVRAERGERVHLAAQVGIRHLADGYRRGGHGRLELGDPAQVDERTEPLDQRVRPGGRIGGRAQHPVQNRQRIGGPPVLLQVTRLPQLVDMIRELVQPTQEQPPKRGGAARPVLTAHYVS